MAERRMIAKSISVSERVNDLPDIFDMLLFTWMIPHVDDWGRMNGSPAKIKGVVIPMLEQKGKADVRDSLERLALARLISWYEIDGEEFVQIEQFDKHQQGLHKRTKSRFPEPPKEENSVEQTEIPGNSGNFPKIPPELNRTELKGTEQKGKEGKGTEPPFQPDTPAPPLQYPLLSEEEEERIRVLLIECKLKGASSYTLDEFKSFGGVVEFGLIEAAIKKSSKKHVNYALNTLSSLAAEGKTKLSDFMPSTKVGEKEKGSGGGGYRGNKPAIPIVQNPAESAKVSDEEFAEYLRIAEERKAASIAQQNLRGGRDNAER